MNGPSTPQDSPKVPIWPVIRTARQRPGDRPLIDSTGRKPHGWKRIETETYIPISALLSDEVVEGVARYLFLRYATGDVRSYGLDRLGEVTRGRWREKARDALQAAIEQVGIGGAK